MRIAVLGSAESWALADLRRAAGDAHQVLAVPYDRLRAEVAAEGRAAQRVSAGPHDLAAMDAVLARAMPPGTLQQVVFRMDALARLEARGVPVLNPPKAMEVAVDKYLATARLQAAGLAVPDTCVCQTAEDALRAFDRMGGDAVVKPIFGSEGRGMVRLCNSAAARETFSELEQAGAAIYVQRFIPHPGWDYRLLVLGGQVWAIRRIAQGDWRTNIACGGRAEAMAADDGLCGAARCAAQAVGALFAGVDLLPGLDGRLYALEVNAAPGWKALAAAVGVDIAAEVLRLLETLAATSVRD